MKRTTTIMMLLASVMVVLAGCQEPLDTTKGSGMKIKISSMSSNLSTKTAYSGEIANGRERIDWKAGDKVRIFSEDISLVANATGVNASGGYIYAQGEAKYYHDYTISSDGTARDGYKSDSSLKDEGEGVGLVWVNDPTGTATVYGIYPTGESIRTTSDDRLRGFSGLTITAPALNWASQSTTVTVNGNSVVRTAKVGTPTDTYMQSAYMVAAPSKFVKKTDEETGVAFPTVDLEFYPIFNAFEFELYGEKDNPITVNSLKLSSTSSNLTGDYAFDYRNRNDVANIYWNNGPLVGGVDMNSGDAAARSKEVTVNFPNGTVISANDTVRFTILTLPPADAKPLTNLTLTVNYGSNQSKSLKLNNNVQYDNQGNPTSEGTPINFPAFHKARITGLALDAGSEWQLTIDGQVLPWIADSQPTTFKHNIGIQDQVFSGFITTDPLYIYEDINNNILRSTEPYYSGQSASPDGYYYLNNGMFTQNGYYLRLTTKIAGVNDPCITYTFTPTLPVGGYWSLAPEAVEGSLDYFRITVDDGINGESERLQGQVMGIPVTIYIRPTAAYLALENAPVCSCIIKCNMSPSATWDPLYSADSEFQGVHTDGTFSYYKYRIAK